MAARRTTSRDRALRELLEALYARYHRSDFLATDPVMFAHRYGDGGDREVVALIAAAFASGNIKSIQAILTALFERLGPRPSRWLLDHRPAQLRGAFRGLYHRWVRESDIEVFLGLVGEALRRHGSLGDLWRHLDDPGLDSTLPTLARFSQAILEMPVEPLVSRERESFREDGRRVALASIESILLTSPARGSACKRMHLFLRWMARPSDGIDLGLWTEFLSPSRLVMPVDTHVLRQCRALRLTRQKVANRRAAEEITARLGQVCPDDPCRYDFSLVRAGIDELRLRRTRVD